MSGPATLAAAIAADGPTCLDSLPTPDQVEAQPAPARRALLDRLRPQLYAIATIVADGTLQRADRARPLYPPYGLARSMFSELRMVRSSPPPFEPDSITGYHGLGRAYIDTMVFHLKAELADIGSSERRWLTGRLEELLSLYRVGANPASRARIRDGFSFLYGGLHFGTGVCVQMVEVMSRLLDEQAPSASSRDRADAIARSIPAVLQLTALNVDHVAAAYQHLQSPDEGPQQPSGRAARTLWLGACHFVLVPTASGQPRRIDLAGDVLSAPGREVQRPTYTTMGCPARVSLSGSPSAIARLWRWAVELAEACDLLSTAGSPQTRY